MTAPFVAVQRTPDGWIHIGGPGMHLTYVEQAVHAIKQN